MTTSGGGWRNIIKWRKMAKKKKKKKNDAQHASTRDGGDARVYTLTLPRTPVCLALSAVNRTSSINQASACARMRRRRHARTRTRLLLPVSASGDALTHSNIPLHAGVRTQRIYCGARGHDISSHLTRAEISQPLPARTLSPHHP